MPTKQEDKIDARLLLKCLRAFSKGDFSARMPDDQTGLAGEIAAAFNESVEFAAGLTSELERIGAVVGKEGKTSQRARLRNAGGAWADAVDSVNTLISDMVQPMTDIAHVIEAIAQGDFTQSIQLDVEGRPLKGLYLNLGQTINTLTGQLSNFAVEVTRVAFDVGTEGKLGGQANVEDVSGTWRKLTENVNQLAGNLTGQVRNIAEVATAVAQGDLSKKITIEAKGEILDLKTTLNTMVDQLNSFAAEVIRVAREVGTEGQLGGQARVEAVTGTWRDLTDNVNLLADNLTNQVRDIAEVTTAVAQGDLTRKVTIEAQGEILDLKTTINTMVDQLNSFAAEVTRVAFDVGTEGKLGGQANVEAVTGTWRELTDNVNMLANNLSNQVRNIAEVTTAVAQGDLTRKITVDAKGDILDLKTTINTMVDQLSSFAAEVTRVAREVGTEGQLGGQANVEDVSGTWRELTDNVNLLADNLTNQVRGIAEVTAAIAQGDLTRKITVDVKGEILDLKTTINTMGDQLSSFAAEVTRVAREVGTEGQLGGQARVEAVTGTWRDLTDNVNLMANNLTEQVRGIATVIVSVANGILTQKLTLTARGEIADLAKTINQMVDTLSIFADQVTSVAREVGREGKLGSQAEVPTAQGIWRDLTDNVNELAGNLTTQVRAIGDVATAVTQGDFNRSITVAARGEVAALRDNVNTMIATLRETTRVNSEQDWLKTNLARFSRMLQGQRDLKSVANTVLSELAAMISAQHGIFYLMENEGDDPILTMSASYAYRERKHLSNHFRPGEGLVGQCALERQRILLTQVPDNYIQISSGLGEAAPLNIVVLPILFEQELIAVIELASFNRFSENHLSFLDQLVETLGIVLNTVGASIRTEKLLQESQAMSQELQAQQEELQQSNEQMKQQQQQLEQTNTELEEQTRKLEEQRGELEQANSELEEQTQKLEEQNTEVERKNREIEEARKTVEEKAEQLAITSKYKSEFLTNMSHELRTPLNSLLILAQLLADNQESNLTEKQIEYAETIHASGADLLNLINEILDLSRIESGVTTVEAGKETFANLANTLERGFRQVARDKGLTFSVRIDESLPGTIYADSKRLLQILRNLLSNAFKFTEEGEVSLRMEIAQTGWSRDYKALNTADFVIAFSVSDTGIGIPEAKQKVIFEAFQQVDGGISRQYSGTGLGLAISREIGRLLNGELRLAASAPDKGSTFSFYLPQSDERAPSPPDDELSNDVGNDRSEPAPDGIAGTKTEIDSPEADEVADDRNKIRSGDAVLLSIEDDAAFARILMDLAHERGYKVLIATRGETGLALARKFQPDAITLDIKLPTMNGWTVLDLLKHDPATRHIPVHIISVEPQQLRGLEQGAIGVLAKPVTPVVLKQTFDNLLAFKDSPKTLLVIENNEAQRNSIIELIGGDDVEIMAVGTAKEALAAIKAKSYDCIVLDLRLPDMTGFTLLNKIKKETLRETPVIVYTGKELTQKEETRLRKMAQTIIIKGARSPERLLDETALFLHRIEADLPDSKRQMLQKAHQIEPVLVGKKVLIVDDDVRNIFAITSLLEQQQMQVIYAVNGQEGIDLLQKTPDVNIILMDIMMPQMDGYEATRQIRQDSRFTSLPIIALTAKAMKGDREQCIQAGTSDYISKPVDNEQLLSLLRVWLYRNS